MKKIHILIAIALLTLTSCKVDMSFMDWSTMTPIYKGEVVECITNGYFSESTFRSAPYFSVRIDGIIEK